MVAGMWWKMSPLVFLVKFHLSASSTVVPFTPRMASPNQTTRLQIIHAMMSNEGLRVSLEIVLPEMMDMHLTLKVRYLLYIVTVRWTDAHPNVARDSATPLNIEALVHFFNRQLRIVL